jgi:hypothetical protein
MVEQIFIYFIYRVYYFQTFVLIPQSTLTLDLSNQYQDNVNYITNSNINLQIEILNGVIAFVVLSHIGLIIFGLFHAIWGQYFYIPFFVENTELHIGPRPKNSVYSGGYTSWQDKEEKEKNLNRFFPKLWYGWFGRGTNRQSQLINTLQKLVKKLFQKIGKRFKR